MTQDLIDYWSIVTAGQKQHPADGQILDQTKHNLNLDCLPSPYGGPIKTAPVVLLYLNPGLSKSDFTEANTVQGRHRALKKLTGTALLPTEEEHSEAFRWIFSRTKLFGNSDWEKIRRSIAVLELCPYHSRNFTDWHLLAALPSARRCLDWAQSVLFREAVTGARVVICLRSPGYWGLEAGKTGRQYGKSLYAPAVNRSGHMLKDEMRGKILESVQRILDI